MVTAAGMPRDHQTASPPALSACSESLACVLATSQSSNSPTLIYRVLDYSWDLVRVLAYQQRGVTQHLVETWALPHAVFIRWFSGRVYRDQHTRSAARRHGLGSSALAAGRANRA
jgi:hypothetical protein